jgi:hypothetical protein
VVVAVPAMGMVEVATDDVVGVIAVGHTVVPAARPVGVSGLMLGAGVARGAGRRVAPANREQVFVDVISVQAVQVAIVQVIGVALVLDGRVATPGGVPVRVALVRPMLHQGLLLRPPRGLLVIGGSAA